MPRSRRARVALAGALALLLVPELAHWLASLSPAPPAGSRCIVLVLGYPSRPDGGPTPIQRYRMRRAVDAYQRFVCEKLVLSGAAVRFGHVEAETMAKLAYSAGVPRDRVVLEAEARTTWENVKLGVPLTAGTEAIVVVSDGVHARRGRRYVCRQFPAQCPKAYVYAPYRPFELWWMKLGGLPHETWALVRDRLFYE